MNFYKPTTTIPFAIVALVNGALFLNKITITGNTILNNRYSFDWISLIGLALLVCGILLGNYSLKSIIK